MAARGNNGKTKTLKGSSQDYTNLLFSESDSDERVPDLKLPPLKGKKQRRRRNINLQPDEVCSVWNGFKVLLVILILAGMTALAAVTFWSLKKITEMEDEIAKVQQSDTTTNIISDLQKKLTALESSVEDLKKSPGEMKASLDGINKKIEELQKAELAQDRKFDDAKGLLDKSQYIIALPKIVVGIGEDVDDHKKRIASLEEEIKKLKSSDPSTASYTTPLVNQPVNNDEQSISMMLEKIQVLNQTLSQDLNTLKDTVDDNQESISMMLEKIQVLNQTLSQDLNTLKDTVDDNQEMKNNTMPSNKPADNQTDIDAIKNDVKELLAMKSEFYVFKGEHFSDLKFVDPTLTNFSAELEDIKEHITHYDKALANLSSIVGQRFQSKPGNTQPTLPLPLTNPASAAVSTPHPAAEKTTGTVEDRENDSFAVPGLHVSQGEPVIPHVKDKTGATDTSIDINNSTSVHEYFQLKNDPVSISDFAKDSGKNEDELRSYDTNADDFISESEMATAKGFSPQPKKRIKRSEW